MDAQQFDRLTQQLSRALTRRRFGAVLATLGFGTGLSAVTSAKPKKGQKKKKKAKPCAAGTVRCGAACIDTRTNAQHCGGCGQSCPDGQGCDGGACQTQGCAGDRELCGSDCVNLDNDEQNCGECGRACGGDLTCIDGDCGCADGTRCGTECIDLDADELNCGECGLACNGDLACLSGACGCATGTQCGNQCVDLDADDAHCGQCDRACGGDLTCISGDCACASGTRCGNQCVNTQTDRRHCGGCDDACTGNQTCSGGECVDPPECVDQYGCGGFSFNDLVCVNGRCVCDTPGEAICQRYSDGRGRCHQCCPDGSGACRFDEVCFYDPDFQSGPLAYCDCPTGWQRCNYNPWPTGTCVEDPMTDSRKCGPFCEDCTASTMWPAICCDGFCTRGCNPGSFCSRNTKCGPNCLPCNSDSICCNQGQGTLPRCIPDLYGGTCYYNI